MPSTHIKLRHTTNESKYMKGEAIFPFLPQRGKVNSQSRIAWLCNTYLGKLTEKVVKAEAEGSPSLPRCIPEDSP